MNLHKIPIEPTQELTDNEKLCAINYIRGGSYRKLKIRVIGGRSILFYWSDTSRDWKPFPENSIRTRASSQRYANGGSTATFSIERYIVGGVEYVAP